MKRQALRKRYGHAGKALTMAMSELRVAVEKAHRAWRKAANATWGARVTYPDVEAKKHARIMKLKGAYEALVDTLTLRARRGEQ